MLAFSEAGFRQICASWRAVVAALLQVDKLHKYAESSPLKVFCRGLGRVKHIYFT